MLLQVEGTGEGQVERNRVSFAAAFDGITVRVRVILLAALVIVVLASRIAIFRVVAWGGHVTDEFGIGIRGLHEMLKLAHQSHRCTAEPS